MAKLYSREATGVYGITPPTKAPASVVQTPVKRVRGSFVSTGANSAAADTLVIGRLPIGAVFDACEITGSASLAAVSMSIGILGSVAKYRANVVGAAADTPSRLGSAVAMAADPNTVEEEVFVTISAALPAGTHVFDLYYSSVAS